MTTRTISRLLFVTLIAGLLTACSPTVRTGKLGLGEAVAAARNNVVSSGKLSAETVQDLRMSGMTEREGIAEAEKAISQPSLALYSTALQQRYAASELMLAKAALNPESPDAVNYYTESARQAFEGMTSPDCSAPISFLCDNFKLFYMRSIFGLVSALGQNNWDVQKLGIKNYTMALRPQSKYEDLSSYDSVDMSGLVSFTGIPNRHHRFGIGLPMVACRQKNESSPEDKYLPSVGTCLPITAVLNFPENCSTSPCPAQLEIYNAFRTETVDIRGRQWPLMANFSTPFATLLEKTGLTDFSGMLQAFEGNETLLKKTGFYTAEPYDSGKIPLVTVHGLFSSPLTWISLQNDLMGDPIIRKHFQIWNYLYPTNLPIVENAKTFREKLDELQQHLEESSPERKGLRDMVIIAHSMGGLLTKTAVGKDSKPMLDYFFSKSDPQTLDKEDAESLEALTKYIDFKCKPYVARAIFVAVPFQGSLIADNWIGSIGRMLISLPAKTLKATVGLAQKMKRLVRPEIASDLEDSDFTSVRGLSPNNPMLKAMAQMAIDQDVPYHLIEGDQGLGGGLDASDGVVAYRSSHLEGAQSELIVPSDHTAHVNPLAVEEIKRILYLHLKTLQEKGKPAPAAKSVPRPLK